MYDLPMALENLLVVSWPLAVLLISYYRAQRRAQQAFTDRLHQLEACAQEANVWVSAVATVVIEPPSASTPTPTSSLPSPTSTSVPLPTARLLRPRRPGLLSLWRYRG
jgi:hypothetical protein